MQAVYYDPATPGAGVIAQGFQKAHLRTRCPKTRKAIARAGDVWHVAAASARDADEVAAAALAAADLYGVGDAVLGGLYSAGVGQAAEEAATDTGVWATAKQLASEAKEAAYATGRGVKEIALERERTKQEALRQMGETVRAPAEAVKAGAEAAGEGTKGFFESLTTGQMIFGALGAAAIIALIAKSS